MGRAKLFLEEMYEIAKTRGGTCLSAEYVNARTKLLWKCSKAHTWKATPNSIKYMESWCNVCARPLRASHRLTITEMKELAKERGGRCLSSRYINGQTKLLWQCEKEHIWKATPTSVKNQGSWCPQCAGFENLPVDLKYLRQIAHAKRGHCLSTQYINARTKLRWRCHYGHIWEATSNSIKDDKSWCPKCGAKRRGRRKAKLL